MPTVVSCCDSIVFLLKTCVGRKLCDKVDNLCVYITATEYCSFSYKTLLVLYSTKVVRLNVKYEHHNL